VWEKAVTYCRQAGAKAATHSAYHEAVAYFEQTLAALRHLPESRDIWEQAIDLQLDLRSALLPLVAFERMDECLRNAQALAETLGDQRRLGRVLSYLVHLLQRLHKYDYAIASGRRALTIAVDTGDLGLQVATNFFLGQIHSGLGDYHEAATYFRSIVDALEGDRLHERFGMVALPAAQARSFLAGCLAVLGAFAEAVIYAEDAVRIAEAMDHPYSLIDASLRVGHLYRHKGNVDKAIPAYEHSRALSQDANIPVPHINTIFGLGAAYILSGRAAAATPLLEQAVEQAVSMPFMPIYSQRLAALSEAYMLAGRMDEAMRHAQHALELAREYQESGDQAGVFRLLGEIAARPDPPQVEQAEDYY
jgi:tetratricopeptide (TPR) repeat protein